MHSVLIFMISHTDSDHPAGVKVGISFLMAEPGGTLPVVSSDRMTAEHGLEFNTRS
jgi:hypothetical protein